MQKESKRFFMFVWCGDISYLSFLIKHLLGSFLEVWASLVIKLLFSISSSSLCLSVLKRWLLVGSWGLLHSHHSSTSLASAVIALHCSHAGVHSRIDAWVSTLSWHDWIIGVCFTLYNFWLLANDIEHGRFQKLLVFGKSVLLPSVVQNLGVQVITLHALVEKWNAVFVVWICLELQGTAMLHILLEFYGIAFAELIQTCLELLLLNIFVLFIFVLAGKILPGQRSS